MEKFHFNEFFSNVSDGSGLVAWINLVDRQIAFLDEEDAPVINPHMWLKVSDFDPEQPQ